MASDSQTSFQSRAAETGRAVYIFLDEAGNLDFSSRGTKFFIISSIIVVRPFPCEAALGALRMDLIEKEWDIEYFHATEDKQEVRDAVFSVIQAELAAVTADSVVIEKRKTVPPLQTPERFYPRMLGYLLRFVVEQRVALKGVDQIIVITDQIPVASKREAIKKAVKMTLAHMLPQTVRYTILHHQAKSCYPLQVVDYITWALFRRWEKGDGRSYELVKHRVKTQFDIFRTGTQTFY
jgi:hypothetical protein